MPVWLRETGREGKRDLTSILLFIRALIPLCGSTLKTSFKCNYLLKVPLPNIIALRIKV